jgi:hypothetical protein
MERLIVTAAVILLVLVVGGWSLWVAISLDRIANALDPDPDIDTKERP